MTQENNKLHSDVLSLKNIFLLYMFSLIFAFVFTPIVLQFVKFCAVQYDLVFCKYILHKGIAKTFDRIRLIPLFVVTIYAIKLKKNEICNALSINKTNYKFFIKTFVCSVLFVLLLIILHLVFWEISFDSNYSGKILNVFSKSFIAALVISVIEEVIFRNILQNVFIRKFGTVTGIVLLSLFFSYLHVKITNKIHIDGISFLDSAQCFYWILFSAFVYFNPIVFLNNFLFGCLLSIFVIKSQSLIKSISVHFGTIMTLMIVRKLLCVDSLNEFWFGRSSIIESSVASLMLCLLIIYMIKEKQTDC